jgi:hypothetical protein
MELGSYQIAGLRCLDYPDNSVTCHARRLVGLPQDNFVTGAALGVNCSDRPLPFFPDIYNEDWFFFSQRAAAREVALVGDAIQERYDPYAFPIRAEQEEFGDLLAEGLFALFARQGRHMPFEQRLGQADIRYWETFFWARRTCLFVTIGELELLVHPSDHTSERVRALVAVRAAERHLDKMITPEMCVEFLQTWQQDRRRWERETTAKAMPPVDTTDDAMASLGLDAWSSVGDDPGRRRAVRYFAGELTPSI